MTSVPPGGSYTPPPPSGSAAPGSDRIVMLVLSYLSLLALIPLLTKKEDREIQWHAKNGLALTAGWFVLWLAFFAIGIALRGPLASLGCGVYLLHCAVTIAFIVVDIVAMVKAIGGQRFRIPVITDMAEKI